MESKEYTYRSLGGESHMTADVYYASSATASASGAQPIGTLFLIISEGILNAKFDKAIMFYGGGFVVGSKELVSKNEIETLVLDFGFVVVVPNYRHCPSVSLYDGPISDAHSCYEWVQNDLPRLLSNVSIIADGGRVAVIGLSAGGTMALHLVSVDEIAVLTLFFYLIR